MLPTHFKFIFLAINHIIEFIKIIIALLKLYIPKLYKEHAKLIYPSLYISTMVMLVLYADFEPTRNRQGIILIISLIVIFLGVKLYQLLNKFLERENKYIELWAVPYSLFFLYFIINTSTHVERFITINLKVQPDTFKDTINYISSIVTFQYSIFMFLFPVTFVFIIKLFGYFSIDVRKEKKISILKKFVELLVSISFFVFVVISLPKIETAAFKTYEYWINKYGFTDVILCDGERYTENKTYENFNAHKVSEQKYIVLDIRSKNYHYNKKSNIERKRYNYYELTCTDINTFSTKFDKIIDEIIFYNK